MIEAMFILICIFAVILFSQIIVIFRIINSFQKKSLQFDKVLAELPNYVNERLREAGI
jgi:hypothetical protein